MSDDYTKERDNLDGCSSKTQLKESANKPMKTATAKRKCELRQRQTQEERDSSNKKRREKWSQKDRDADTTRKREKRGKLTQDERDSCNKKKRETRSQKDRHADTTRKREKRGKQTQEERDAVNKKRREQRAIKLRQKRAPLHSGCTAYNPILNEGGVKISNVGSMTHECFSCKALMFRGETHTGTIGKDATFSMCCSYGKVKLPPIKPPPDELRNLFTEDNKSSKAFRNNIRKYNSALALSSIGVDLGSVFQFKTTGPYVYKMNGQMYHSLGAILPEPDKEPTFSQLYVYDQENELSNRLKRNPDMDRECLALLQDLMHRHNPYVQQYMQVSVVIPMCFIYIQFMICMGLILVLSMQSEWEWIYANGTF